MRRARAAAAVMTLAALAGCGGPMVVHTTSAKAELRAIHSRAAEHARPAPPSTGAATTTTAPCPFLSTDFVQQTVGQHIARTTTTSTVPSSCAFYRPDGGLAAKIERRTYPDAAAATAHTTTGAGSNPVTDMGDGGSVSITANGAMLAVSEGPVLVTVTINQQSSLECHEIAARSLPTS